MKLDDLKHVFKSSTCAPVDAKSYIVNLLNKFEVALTWDNRTLLIPSLLPSEEQLRSGLPGMDVQVKVVNLPGENTLLFTCFCCVHLLAFSWFLWLFSFSFVHLCIVQITLCLRFFYVVGQLSCCHIVPDLFFACYICVTHFVVLSVHANILENIFDKSIEVLWTIQPSIACQKKTEKLTLPKLLFLVLTFSVIRQLHK